MKLAVVYQYFYPTSLGGGERRFYEVFSRINHSTDWYIQGKNLVKDENNIKVISLTKNSLNKRSLFETLLWAIVVLKIPFSKYDVIHIGQMPFLHIFTLLLKNKLIKLIGRPHPILSVDWWEHWDNYWDKYKFPFNFFGKAIEKFILKNLDHIIVLSEKTKDDISNISNAKINLIHNGVDIESIDQAISSKKADFVYFGRLENHKKVDQSIEVFSKLVKLNPEYKFIIIGDGPCKSALELLTHKYKLNNSICFTGKLNNNIEMYSIIKGSDCMLFFGSQEGGASISLFEANACGIPVAHSFSENGIDEKLITNNNGFFFNEFNVELIANEIHSYMNDASRQKILKKSCREFVKDRDWSLIGENYENYFNKLYKDSK